jgi:peroxin-1
MEVASTVDMESISFDTDGFSGADLQAMMYNAHLEVIHAQIDSAASARKGVQANGAERVDKGKRKGKGKEQAVNEDDGAQEAVKVEEIVRYRSIPEQDRSRAEKAAFGARVGVDSLFLEA